MITAIIAAALTAISKGFDFAAVQAAKTSARIAALKARIAKNKDVQVGDEPK